RGAIQDKEPPALPAHVPQQLQQIVYRALAKDRNKRYQSAKDLLIDLRSVRTMLYSGSISAKRMVAGVIADGNRQRHNTPEAQMPTGVLASIAGSKKAHQTSAISFLGSLGQRKYNIVTLAGLLALLLGLCIAVVSWFRWD